MGRIKNRVKPLNINTGACNPKHDFTLVFDGQTLSPSTTAKYLRFFIDDHLLFKRHINCLVNKIARVCGAIARLSFYLSYNTLIILYYRYTLVQSHLLYALPVWASTYKT